MPSRVQVAPDSSGCGVPRAHTPLKRSRADVQQRISGDLARTGCELPVDEVVDHVRSQKRFVSEVRFGPYDHAFRLGLACGTNVHYKRLVVKARSVGYCT